MPVKRRSQALESDHEPDLVDERRPRRRTRRVPPQEKQPEGDHPVKSDVSEPAPAASVAAKIPDSKPEAREPPATTAPKVLAAVTLRQQNLRPPLLARPPALPPKPKLRQHHYEFLSDWRRHQMALAAAAGSRPALTALPVDVVRAPSLLPPMPRLPASSAPSLGDDSGQTADLEAAIAAVLRAGNPPQQPGGATDVHTGVRPPDPAPQASADGLDASCLPGRLEGALGSGLYRLPSDAQLLSFASCIAA